MRAVFQTILAKLSPRFFTLKFRLKVLITFILIAVVGGPLFFLVYQLEKNRQEFTINMIETTTHAVYQSVFEEMLRNDDEGIQRNLELLTLRPNIELLRIYKPSGEVIHSTRPAEIGKNIFGLKDRVYFQRLPSGEQEAFVKVGNIYSHHHPIYVQKECQPCHTDLGAKIAFLDVQVGLSDAEQVYASVKQLTVISAVLIVAILWLVLNLLYESQIESRLQKLIAGFHKLAGGNLNFTVQMPGRHELADLTQQFNQTVDKLRQAKAKEDQMIQENLARADRLVTLGEVAAEIAHEVNNPAGIILTRAELIRDEMQDEANDTYLEDIEIIIRQTEKIADTTRSILHYARQLPQSFSDTDLNEVIAQSIKILRPRIQKARVNISFTPLEQPAIIRGNYNQLEQVFCNLTNNSLDVLPPLNGRIEVALTPLPANGNGGGYQIRFTDNGPGIPETIREEIFSPFFTTKEDGKGTGLGLFIVRNIIAHHHGRIILSANGSAGATFLIEIRNGNGKV